MKLASVGLALAFATSGCAVRQAPPPPPNPASADDPLRTWERDVAFDTRAIYARNDDKVPHTITWLALYDCKHVAETCGEMTLNLTVKPGETITVLTVKAKLPPGGGTMWYKFELKYQ